MDSRLGLPAELSGFVGRASEAAQLAALLEASRLVTVTGPGGVGKTRLALHAAALADDMCLVELSGLRDPELIPDTIALRLGLQRRPGTDWADAAGRTDAVLRELRGRDLLLVLDTCEHLAPACAQFVTAVLRETSGIRVLATSRQPLHVPGEQVLRLGPLFVPDDDAASLADVVTAGGAVQLFAQRARAADGSFTLTAAELPHVIRLCRRLDGIPLAIELAAVRVRALPLRELAARVDAGIAAGTGAKRGGTDRHQTLQAAIGWSYGLCGDAEQSAWRRLSVFAGTFDPVVAADVIADSDLTAQQAADAIRGLVDKSVAFPAAPGRYRLLDTVRDYGAARLSAEGEDEACRERYLARYLEMSTDFRQGFASGEQCHWLGTLRAEHENLRCVLEYALSDARRAEATTMLTSRLAMYWLACAMPEGARWLDRALLQSADPSPWRASLLSACAFIGAWSGAIDAVDHASEAVAVAVRTDDKRFQGVAYKVLHWALCLSGRYDEALEAAAEARRLLTPLNEAAELGGLDVQLAYHRVQTREIEAALEHCRDALHACPPGDYWTRGNADVMRTLAYYTQPGRREECARSARTALWEMLQIGYVAGTAFPLEILAWLSAEEGHCAEAALLLGAAARLWQQTGLKPLGSQAGQAGHNRVAAKAEAALGTARYAELHASGATLPLQRIAAFIGIDTATLPPWLPGAATARGERSPSGDWLSSRDREIAQLVADGLSNREIAVQLRIPPQSIDAQVNDIFAKLGLSTTAQLAVWLRDRVPASLPDELLATPYA